MTAAGAGPGAAIIASGLHFTMPNVAADLPDNTICEGQVIQIGARGSTIGFLISASYGSASGTVTVTYTDGTIQRFGLTAPDWTFAAQPPNGSIAVTSAYRNVHDNKTSPGTVYIFAQPITVNASKTVATVTLPAGGALASGTPALHIWAISLS